VSVRARHSKCTLLPQTRDENAVSIEAAIAIRETFAKGSPADRALFYALVGRFTGGGHRHYYRVQRYASVALLAP